MLVTKEQILSSAFNCFNKYGFEKTSLEAIAQEAGVTRGAIYWHFADKETLYREVVICALQKGDVADFAERISVELPFEERLDEVFWMAINENKYVHFVFMSMNYVSLNREKFPDLMEHLMDNKMRLLRFFDNEVRYYMRYNRITDLNPELYSSSLFLLFEGLFLSKNISNLFTFDRDSINLHIRLIISDLLCHESQGESELN